MTPAADNDRIREKIRKLLNLAENDAAMGLEIDNAIRMARQLMVEHNISEGEVRSAGEERSPEDIVRGTQYARVERATSNMHLQTWEISLVSAVLNLIGTVKWYRTSEETIRRDLRTGFMIHSTMQGRTHEPAKALKYVLYGPAEDCEDASQMINEWSILIITLASAKWGHPFKGPGRSYAEGFAEALRAKVQEAIRQETAALPESSSTSAIQLRKATSLMALKKVEADRWLERQGVRLGKASMSSPSGQYHGDARSDGTRDGRAASFTHSRKPKLGGG